MPEFRLFITLEVFFHQRVIQALFVLTHQIFLAKSYFNTSDACYDTVITIFTNYAMDNGGLVNLLLHSSEHPSVVFLLNTRGVPTAQ